MKKHSKDRIITLLQQGLTGKEICDKLRCGKSLVTYYKNKFFEKPLDCYTPDKIKEYQEYYTLGHSLKNTAIKFNLSRQKLGRILQVRNKRTFKSTTEIIQQKKAYRNSVKFLCVEYKGGSCIICGYSKCIKALDFHHINPKEKDFSISGGTKGFENLKIELDKCILVCRNCHSEIHDGLHPDIYPLPDKQ